MFPSEFFLDPRVRSGDDATTDLPLFILNCKDRKAEGYADDKLLERYNKRLRSMVIGVHLASAPPAVSYLAIRGPPVFAEIVAIDKTVMVISLGFTGEEAGPLSYLIYDSVALSLRMIPQPENPYNSRVSIARPGDGEDYALVYTGFVSDDSGSQDDDEDSGSQDDDEDSGSQDDDDSDADDEDDSLFLWRPSSSLTWSEKKSSFPDTMDWSVDKIDTEFSFDGHVYWVDLLCGVSYCSCDDLFNDTTNVLKVGGFIHLPVERMIYSYSMAEPETYRTMGVVGDSFIRFISIDGFRKHKHTVTVWKLLDQDKVWEKEHELSMETLRGFKGFDDLPKNLKPMYPLLSTKDTDVVYLMLGKYQGLIPSAVRYHLTVDLRKKIVTSVPLEDWCPEFISCGFSREALLGPCNDKGVPISMKKKKRHRYNGRNVADSSIPTKKPRLEKRTCY